MVKCKGCYPQSVWEKQRKGKDNQLTRFLASWIKVHSLTANTGSTPTEESQEANVTGGHSRVPKSEDRERTSEDDVLSEDDDIQDLELDSDESDG